MTRLLPPVSSSYLEFTRTKIRYVVSKRAAVGHQPAQEAGQAARLPWLYVLFQRCRTPFGAVALICLRKVVDKTLLVELRTLMP